MCAISAYVMGGNGVVSVDEGVVGEAIGELAIDWDY